ncbi:NUDIX hydrolase [Paenibacillus sp. CC-CFT747]|nr:NUDIX hydrolase [Paenibacillus sp. CC-CFT747]
MKQVSVGCLITDGKAFLACHSTGNSFYDLPKGLPEPGETPIETCCREVEEETGLTPDPSLLVEEGVHAYLKNKDLHLFVWPLTPLPEVRTLHCRSTFLHPRTGKALPEVDGYKHVLFSEADAYMAKSMAAVLRTLNGSRLLP